FCSSASSFSFSSFPSAVGSSSGNLFGGVQAAPTFLRETALGLLPRVVSLPAGPSETPYSPVSSLGRWSAHWTGRALVENVPLCLSASGLSAVSTFFAFRAAPSSRLLDTVPALLPAEAALCVSAVTSPNTDRSQNILCLVAQAFLHLFLATAVSPTGAALGACEAATSSLSPPGTSSACDASLLLPPQRSPDGESLGRRKRKSLDTQSTSCDSAPGLLLSRLQRQLWKLAFSPASTLPEDLGISSSPLWPDVPDLLPSHPGDVLAALQEQETFLLLSQGAAAVRVSPAARRPVWRRSSGTTARAPANFVQSVFALLEASSRLKVVTASLLNLLTVASLGLQRARRGKSETDPRGADCFPAGLGCEAVAPGRAHVSSSPFAVCLTFAPKEVQTVLEREDARGQQVEKASEKKEVEKAASRWRRKRLRFVDLLFPGGVLSKGLRDLYAKEPMKEYRLLLLQLLLLLLSEPSDANCAPLALHHDLIFLGGGGGFLDGEEKEEPLLWTAVDFAQQILLDVLDTAAASSLGDAEGEKSPGSRTQLRLASLGDLKLLRLGLLLLEQLCFSAGAQAVHLQLLQQTVLGVRRLESRGRRLHTHRGAGVDDAFVALTGGKGGGRVEEKSVGGWKLLLRVAHSLLATWQQVDWTRARLWLAAAACTPGVPESEDNGRVSEGHETLLPLASVETPALDSGGSAVFSRLISSAGFDVPLYASLGASTATSGVHTPAFSRRPSGNLRASVSGRDSAKAKSAAGGDEAGSGAGSASRSSLFPRASGDGGDKGPVFSPGFGDEEEEELGFVASLAAIELCGAFQALLRILVSQMHALPLAVRVQAKASEAGKPHKSLSISDLFVDHAPSLSDYREFFSLFFFLSSDPTLLAAFFPAQRKTHAPHTPSLGLSPLPCTQRSLLRLLLWLRSRSISPAYLHQAQPRPPPASFSLVPRPGGDAAACVVPAASSPSPVSHPTQTASMGGRGGHCSRRPTAAASASLESFSDFWTRRRLLRAAVEEGVGGEACAFLESLAATSATSETFLAAERGRARNAPGSAFSPLLSPSLVRACGVLSSPEQHGPGFLFDRRSLVLLATHVTLQAFPLCRPGVVSETERERLPSEWRQCGEDERSVYLHPHERVENLRPRGRRRGGAGGASRETDPGELRRGDSFRSKETGRRREGDSSAEASFSGCLLGEAWIAGAFACRVGVGESLADAQLSLLAAFFQLLCVSRERGVFPLYYLPKKEGNSSVQNALEAGEEGGRSAEPEKGREASFASSPLSDVQPPFQAAVFPVLSSLVEICEREKSLSSASCGLFFRSEFFRLLVALALQLVTCNWTTDVRGAAAPSRLLLRASQASLHATEKSLSSSAFASRRASLSAPPLSPLLRHPEELDDFSQRASLTPSRRGGEVVVSFSLCPAVASGAEGPSMDTSRSRDRSRSPSPSAALSSGEQSYFLSRFSAKIQPLADATGSAGRAAFLSPVWQDEALKGAAGESAHPPLAFLAKPLFAAGVRQPCIPSAEILDNLERAAALAEASECDAEDANEVDTRASGQKDEDEEKEKKAASLRRRLRASELLFAVQKGLLEVVREKVYQKTCGEGVEGFSERFVERKREDQKPRKQVHLPAFASSLSFFPNAPSGADVDAPGVHLAGPGTARRSGVFSPRYPPVSDLQLSALLFASAISSETRQEKTKRTASSGSPRSRHAEHPGPDAGAGPRAREKALHAICRRIQQATRAAGHQLPEEADLLDLLAALYGFTVFSTVWSFLSLSSGADGALPSLQSSRNSDAREETCPSPLVTFWAEALESQLAELLDQTETVWGRSAGASPSVSESAPAFFSECFAFSDSSAVSEETRIATLLAKTPGVPCLVRVSALLRLSLPRLFLNALVSLLDASVAAVHARRREGDRHEEKKPAEPGVATPRLLHPLAASRRASEDGLASWRRASRAEGRDASSLSTETDADPTLEPFDPLVACALQRALERLPLRPRRRAVSFFSHSKPPGKAPDVFEDEAASDALEGDPLSSPPAPLRAFLQLPLVRFFSPLAGSLSAQIQQHIATLNSLFPGVAPVVTRELWASQHLLLRQPVARCISLSPLDAFGDRAASAGSGPESQRDEDSLFSPKTSLLLHDASFLVEEVALRTLGSYVAFFALLLQSGVTPRRPGGAAALFSRAAAAAAPLLDAGDGEGFFVELHTCRNSRGARQGAGLLEAPPTSERERCTDSIDSIANSHSDACRSSLFSLAKSVSASHPSLPGALLDADFFISLLTLAPFQSFLHPLRTPAFLPLPRSPQKDVAPTVSWLPAYEALVTSSQDASCVGKKIRRSPSHLLFCRLLGLLALGLRQLRPSSGGCASPSGFIPGDSGVECGTQLTTEAAGRDRERARTAGLIRSLQLLDGRMQFVLGPQGFAQTPQLATLEEAALYAQLLTLLPPWRSMEIEQQQLVWRWFSLLRDFALSVVHGLLLSLVDGTCVLRPVSLLECLACQPPTASSPRFSAFCASPDDPEGRGESRERRAEHRQRRGFWGDGGFAEASLGEDTGESRRVIPSTFDQRGIYLMLQICNHTVSAFSKFGFLLPLSHTLPPPPPFFLPGCACCSSSFARFSSASSRWCRRVRAVSPKSYCALITSLFSSPRDEETRLASPSRAGRQGREGNGRKDKPEEEKRDAALVREREAEKAEGPQGEEQRVLERRRHLLRDADVESEIPPPEREAPTPRGGKCAKRNAAARERRDFLPTADEVAQTLAAFVEIARSLAKALEELAREDRTPPLAVLTAGDRRFLPLSLFLRCEGPYMNRVSTLCSSPRPSQRQTSGEMSLLASGWARSPTPGSVSPSHSSVCGAGRASSVVSMTAAGFLSEETPRELARRDVLKDTGLKDGGGLGRDGASVVSTRRGPSTELQGGCASFSVVSAGRQRAEQRRSLQRRRRSSPTVTACRVDRVTPRGCVASLLVSKENEQRCRGRDEGLVAPSLLGIGEEDEELEVVCPDLLLQDALWELLRDTLEKAMAAGTQIVNAFVAQNILRPYADAAKQFLLLLIHLGAVSGHPSMSSLPSPSSFLPAGAAHFLRATETKGEETGKEIFSGASSRNFYATLLEYLLKRYAVEEKIFEAAQGVGFPFLLDLRGEKRKAEGADSDVES
ncbi:putative nucleoporin FG repeat protein, partial [Toxoplasma gondii RUB]